ncbi:hypothetical protein PG993_000147 [Apiospora rasikravindrae]|uniref:Uncharacterized protein n=1 Tax=Apiospora rasikravindrae TaxID=990691 RepID=A0ABR1U9Z3_9PEZI
MPDDSILGKRQADSCGRDSDQDRKRIHYVQQPLADQTDQCYNTTQPLGPRVLPSLSDLFGSPSPWTTIVHSAVDSLSHQDFGQKSELSNEAQHYWDNGSVLWDGNPNQLVGCSPTFQTDLMSTQHGSPFANFALGSLEHPMQYSFTNDAMSRSRNTSSLQPIGTQPTELNQFYDAPECQTIPTASKDVLAVHGQQTIASRYCTPTPVVTELSGTEISPFSCSETFQENPQIGADSGDKAEIDTCFGVIITTPTCFATGKEPKPSTAVRLDSCATFLKLHDKATDKYIGLLNTPALCKLLSLFPIRLKAHMSPVTVLAPFGKQAKDKGAVSGSSTEYSLRVVVEGSKKDGRAVGRLLSDAGLFLQHPSTLEHDLNLEYFNSQFLIRPGGDMPTLDDLAIEDDEQGLRSKQLDDITKAQLLRMFDNANATAGNARIDIIPSSRLRTSLMPHQLKALGMMLERESGVIESGQFPSLWARDQNDPNCTIYRHRITGLSTRSPNIMSGGVIADDMGLGKSLSLLALICSSLDHSERMGTEEQASASTLIVAPKSVISAWETQLTRHIHAARVKMLLYHGVSRNLYRGTLGDFDIVLTTYDTLRSDFTLKGPLYARAWLRMALDEAHHIRNRNSQIFQACCEIQARYRWCLTGTPVQNSLDDYGSLLSFLKIDPFQDKKEFDHWIAKPFYKGDKHSLNTLRCLTISTCFRRTKATVNLTNPLPERDDIVHDVTLLPNDQKMYEFFKKIIQDKVTGATRNKKHGNVLAYITTLRRICDHTQLLSPKAIETWSQGDSDDANSTFMSTSTTNCDVCGEEHEESTSPSGSPRPCQACVSKEDVRSTIDTPNDSNATTWPSHCQFPTSAKIEALLETLQQRRTGLQAQRCPKSVVFTAWTKMLDLVQQALQAMGFNCQRIDGQTSLQGRSSAMKVFSEDDACTVMLATIGSAGEGVDFTTAQYVHLLEPHWNPMAEAQAVDRVHRIGQTRPVTVIRYIVPSSIESYIQWVQQDKMRTISMSLDTISDADKAEERRWEGPEVSAFLKRDTESNFTTEQMMFSSIRLLGVILLLAPATMADRVLPADLQVDLIFPRNDTTYAPTQWFPVVFGVKNLDAVWPMGISLGVSVIDDQFWKNESSRGWQYQLPSIDFAKALDSTAPGEYLFHIPAVNMTNGTTSSYTVGWELNIRHRCFDNGTDRKEDGPRDGWSNSPDGVRRRWIVFHTAPGGELPDIEATVNSCREPDVDPSTAVRVTKMGETQWKYPAETCPWLETDIRPSKCAFQPVAKALAANVSETMLSKMRCKEGSWQTITAPCPRESMASSLHTMGVGLVLPFAFALFNLLL